jgi:hypothetical protein
VVVVVAAELTSLNLTYFCHLHTTVSFVQKLVSCFGIFFIYLFIYLFIYFIFYFFCFFPSFIIPYLVGLYVVLY